MVCGYNVNNLLSQTLSSDMNLVRRVEESEQNGLSKHYDSFGEHGPHKTDPVKIQLKDSRCEVCSNTNTAKGERGVHGGKWHHRAGDTTNGMVCADGSHSEEKWQD